MRFFVLHKLINTALLLLVCLAAWLRLTGAIVTPWPVIALPLVCTGLLTVLLDASLFARATWKAGCILVARSDNAARKGHTIRRATP